MQGGFYQPCHPVRLHWFHYWCWCAWLSLGGCLFITRRKGAIGFWLSPALSWHHQQLISETHMFRKHQSLVILIVSIWASVLGFGGCFHCWHSETHTSMFSKHRSLVILIVSIWLSVFRFCWICFHYQDDRRYRYLPALTWHHQHTDQWSVMGFISIRVIVLGFGVGINSGRSRRESGCLDFQHT